MNEQNKNPDNEVFSGANVPISIVAKIMKKDPMAIRCALRKGILPIGFAILKNENGKQYDYYVSPKLLFEYCGFRYRPEDSKKSEDETI